MTDLQVASMLSF